LFAVSTKLLYGKKHFKAIGFEDFAVAEKEDLGDLINKNK